MITTSLPEIKKTKKYDLCSTLQYTHYDYDNNDGFFMKLSSGGKL